MPKQTSLVTFTGKMGGISFYKKDGKHVARVATGPSRARILNDKRFSRTRENMSEFSAMALATASLNRTLTPVKNLKGPDLRSRVSKMLRGIIRTHAGTRGQRPVLITQNRSSFIGLELNGASQLQTNLTAKPVISHSADRKTATCVLAQLKVKAMLSAPVGTTHVQFVQWVGVVSDVVFNNASQQYELADAARNAISNVTFSDYIPLDSDDAVALNLQTALAVDLNDQVSVMQAVGMLFFSKNGTAYYPVQQGKCMQIVDVY